MTTDPLSKARDPLIGTRIDERYFIQAVLGRGGMGVVYEGVHEQLGRQVAIKVLAASISGDPVAVQRFLREAQTASQLTHGNIVDVSDLGVLPDGRPYLVMARIHGTDLATLLEKQGPQTLRRTVELLIGAAAALDLIHAKGFVHRDVKPENLMHVVREDGSETTLLLDFGIVGLISGQVARLTAEGSVFGTPAYLAPEVIQGGQPDRRADVYALATVAFELLTGRPPFEGDNPLHILPKKVLNDAPRLRGVSQIAFPPDVEEVIDRGLTRDPGGRWETAGEFVAALDEAVTVHEEDTGQIEPRSRSNTMRRPGGTGRSQQRRTQPVLQPQPEPARSGFDSAELPVGRTNHALADSKLEELIEASMVSLPPAPPLELEPTPTAARDGTTTVVRNGLNTLSTELEASVLAPIRRRRGLRIGLAALGVFAVILVAGLLSLSGDEPPPAETTRPPAVTAKPEPQPTAATVTPTPAPTPTPIPTPTVSPAPTPPPEVTARPGRTRPSKAEARPSPKRVEAEPIAPAPKPGKSSVSSGELVQAAARELIQGHLNAAADLYSQAARIDPKNEAAFRGLGLVNERLGRKADAIRAFNRALALSPNGQNAAMLRARLAKLQASP